LSHRLGDLAARGTLIGHVCFCQDLGLSWKSTSSRAGCVYASHRSLDKHLSDRSLWADSHSVGRKPGNIRRSFAGRTLEQKPNDFVPFGFVLCRFGFVRRHRVSDDAHPCPNHLTGLYGHFFLPLLIEDVSTTTIGATRVNATPRAVGLSSFFCFLTDDPRF